MPIPTDGPLVDTRSSPTLLASANIALTLSGGGIRAVLFHLGVLSCLAEKSLLERVRYVSTVSGGTLLAGLVFKLNGYQWPSSQQFRGSVVPALKRVLSTTNLQRSALIRLLYPWNWRYLPFRANVLASTIAHVWGISEPISRLPPTPIWAINATTVETGRRWRFRVSDETHASSRFGMGDGEVGYTFDRDFPLASAMATSAAFPGGISPLVLGTAGHNWYVPNFDDRSQPPEKVSPKFASYHLADGGVYDNLGFEPVFDASSRRIRAESGCDYIIASDAGAPLKTEAWGPISQLLGFNLRTVNIMSSQQRDLRVRTLVGAIVSKGIRGVFINIAEPARTALEKARLRGIPGAGSLTPDGWLPTAEATAVASFATTLEQPSRETQELIQRHGYEVAQAQLSLYGGQVAWS